MGACPRIKGILLLLDNYYTENRRLVNLARNYGGCNTLKVLQRDQLSRGVIPGGGLVNGFFYVNHIW